MARFSWLFLCTGPLVAACNNDPIGTTSGDSTGPDITTVDPTSSGGATTGNPPPTTSSAPTGTDSDEGTASATDSDSGETEGTTVDVTVTQSDPSSTTGTESDTAPDCEAGEVVCEDDVAKVCDGMGGYTEETPCEGPCQPGLGCLVCTPDEAACDGDTAMQCASDGLAWEVHEVCDGLQGVTCNPEVGLCDGECALENLQLSYIGCDYYPTVTLQHDSYNSGTKIFAAVIANTTAQDATVTITRGDMMVKQVVVEASSVEAVTLPWVPELTKGLGPTKVVPQGAYRLRSNHPVTVYQYNLLYASASNDASLLLPVNAWTGDYLVASYGHAANNDYPGFYAVVAREDGTTVTLSPSGTGGKVQAGDGVAADGTGQVMLDAGDVLQVATDDGGDLTGTRVSADRPVQVLAGHKCTQVPAGVELCDHLEEAMFPVEALAQEYIVVPPVQSPNAAKDHAQVVRIVASEPDTTLVYTPNQPFPKVLAEAGDFVEIESTTARFQVAADKKILVAQYMVGQGGGFGEQDPSMLLAVATEQFREDYLFHAPVSWTANYVDVVLKTGTTVSVDGVQLMANAIQPIVGTEYSVAHVKLSNMGDGNHTLTASDPVGISVYGIQDFGSYWAVGGLDLAHL
jgi:hypothetical protein